MLYQQFKSEGKVFIEPLRSEISFNQNQSIIDFHASNHLLATKIRLQYITEISENVSTQTQINGNENLNELAFAYFKQNPKVIQINDLISMQKDEGYIILKVIEIEYKENVKQLYSKVLDLKEPQIDKYLSKLDHQIANEISFNKYFGYLAHHSALTSVEIIHTSNTDKIEMPRYFFRNLNKICILRKYQIFKKTRIELNQSLHCQSGESRKINMIHLFGQSGCGKTTMLRDLADKNGILYKAFDCLDYYNIIQLKKLITEIIYDLSIPFKGVLIELNNFDQYKLLIDQFSQGGSKSKRDLTEMRFSQAFEESLNELQSKISDQTQITLVFPTQKKSDISDIFAKLIRNKIQILNPEKQDRDAIVRWMLEFDSKLKLDIEIILKLNINEIAKYLQGKTVKEIRNTLIKILKSRNELNNDILMKRLQDLEKQRKAFGEKSVRIPEVKWADVGGLANAKEDILQTIMLPIEKPHLFKNGIAQRSGLLFYGPPGTGKTLLAKAIATECQMNFISVKGPELLNMYVGESEKNVREVFERARENLPCIIFFDELDSLAPARGKGADSSQVMDRIVAQLLTEIDGLGKKGGMFVIGATNRPDLLDSALLRTGRFDKMIYLGVAKTSEERVKIIQAQTRNLKLEEGIDLNLIVQNIPENFTGADFSALTTESYMIAVKEKIEDLEVSIKIFKQENNIPDQDEILPETYLKLKYGDDKIAQDREAQILIKQDHMIRALSKITPSISLEELRKYEELRDKYTASES
ncbi:aaa atpase domain-containing protein [Stylonychia lemnae]|uniref:Peroxisomal ATPase PEX6 n=1 Tax=Stylonychia lemnae TaxID=5949 RepID=A0A078AZZ1_STYLE|nr:aaa atpase domain-containing protein [Stylonychia lemnae]|eukprot:CDW87814.1 aaa atpase domain-containing protein [Stylonychia lemnae]